MPNARYVLAPITLNIMNNLLVLLTPAKAGSVVRTESVESPSRVCTWPSPATHRPFSYVLPPPRQCVAPRVGLPLGGSGEGAARQGVSTALLPSLLAHGGARQGDEIKRFLLASIYSVPLCVQCCTSII